MPHQLRSLHGAKGVRPRRKIAHDDLGWININTRPTTLTPTRARKSRDVSKTTMAAPPNIHPFQLILQEHARFMMAIKDLQSQVQALQEFRSRVCLAFPHLDTGPLPQPPPHPTTVHPATTAKMTRQAVHHLVTTPGVTSPKKAAGQSSPAPGSKTTGARVLPSVHQAASPGTVVIGGGAGGRHVITKSHQSSFGHDREAERGQNAANQNTVGSKNSTVSRGRGLHHHATAEPTWNSNKKFIVVAQGKNWLRIRPCADKPDSESSEDSDDEHNSTSDSLHSMAAERDNNKRKGGGGRVGSVVIAATSNGASNGRATKSDGSATATATAVGFRGQDSGFSTDGKERLKGDHEAHSSTSSDMRWSKVGRSSSADDELMTLLDAIGQKSLVLRRQADKLTASSPTSSGASVAGGILARQGGIGGGLTLSDIGLKPDDVLAELERLRLEKEQILERLVSVESEKELYRGEMVQLRDVLLETESVRRALEERLEVVFSERERLGSRIHRLHSQFARGGAGSREEDRRGSSSALVASRFLDDRERIRETTIGGGVGGGNVRRSSVVAVGGTEKASPLVTATTTPTSAQIVFNGSSSLPDRLGRSSKLKVRMDKAKISAILRESRSLELQRQLLVAVLRNEVLKTQLEHNLGEWQERALSWQRAEQSLLLEADEIRQSNCELRVKLQHTETDLKLERSKRQVLEQALQAAYKDLTTNSGSTSSSRGGAAGRDLAPTIASEHVRQLSVDAFPVNHQAALLTNSADKMSDLHSSASTMANTTITMASSIYKEPPNTNNNYRRMRSNSHGQLMDATSPQTTSQSPRANNNTSSDPYGQKTVDSDHEFGNYNRASKSSKTDVADVTSFVSGSRSTATTTPTRLPVTNNNVPATVTFKTVQPSSGNVTVRIVSPNTYRQPQSGNQSPPRNERSSAADVRLPKPSSYTSGLSPKNRNKIFISKCSQSAEDLRNSDWEWAYDINRSSAQHLNMAQHMVIAEAMT